MLNVLIPMAGAGKRFQERGYKDPKPFIPIHGRPMISHIIENLGIPGARHIFLAQKGHLAMYGPTFVTEVLNKSHVRDYRIVEVDKLTEGAACTTLLAEALIDNQDELLIANSDQLVGAGSVVKAIYKFEKMDCHGILCFPSRHSKWSYMAIDSTGVATRIAEKDPISDIATCGIYYWKTGADYCRSARMMIAANDRVNGEFYIAPTYNYLIQSGEKVRPFMVDTMIGLGTPEDVERYLNGASEQP